MAQTNLSCSLATSKKNTTGSVNSWRWDVPRGWGWDFPKKMTGVLVVPFRRGTLTIGGVAYFFMRCCGEKNPSLRCCGDLKPYGVRCLHFQCRSKGRGRGGPCPPYFFPKSKNGPVAVPFRGPQGHQSDKITKAVTIFVTQITISSKYFA